MIFIFRNYSGSLAKVSANQSLSVASTHPFRFLYLPTALHPLSVKNYLRQSLILPLVIPFPRVTVTKRTWQRSLHTSKTWYPSFLKQRKITELRSTMVFIWESTKPLSCSKLSLFKTNRQMLDVLPQLSLLYSYLPYLRAFSISWPFASRGIKNTRGQSWKRLYLLHKRWTFNFDLLHFWYPLR